MKTPLPLSLLSLLCLATYTANTRDLVVSDQPIALKSFKLNADLSTDHATFTLDAIAHVEDSNGGTLDLLSGAVALTDIGTHPRWRVEAGDNRYCIRFERSGDFPLHIRFNAAVRQSDGWSAVDFRVATSTLQPIVLSGLGADTQFRFPGAGQPEWKQTNFVSYLPPNGAVNLSWKQERKEVEGKLFYAGEMLSQISISPGLMRQVALVDFKVMQGEMNRAVLNLHGTGEVTRVVGDQVLAWNVETIPGSNDRRLILQLNQPQKDQFAVQVQLQTPLGAFPQTADAIQLRPEGATRFAGFLRIVNDGAVRLEVTHASGMSQVSPDQFPESAATRAALRADGNQRFAYRFSGADFALKIQADQILPELGVSEVLAYHHGENELAIDAEIELDVREAPLRELLLRIPTNYAIARLSASGMNDYFVRDAATGNEAELRLQYSQPVTGRQVVQLRLERNQPPGQTNWILPRIEVVQAKSVRGFVGVSCDAGFRLTPQRTTSLTEMATAFFPRKTPGIQAAFRLNESAWQATLRVERLPQTIQADVFHLFSVGEGIAYGSSVINYLVSGAPVSAVTVGLSDEYFNVEFTGKDVRNWQKVDGGYLVQLHTPVSGAYTLLATYERPFKSQGETLAFTGARPVDAQSEQGHTLVISAYQFQVNPVEVSPGLLPLETAEVPPEYRLFFDAPILAAYRYASRPFDLKLALRPLAQGGSLNQVVDRASLTTHISKEGQVITDVQYLVKSRGNPNFRLTLPEGVQLWSATVGGTSVVPVKDGKASLIPLPQHNDPDEVLSIQLKLAAESKSARHLTIGAPILAAPVTLAEWKLEPDEGQRLVYRQGSLTPVGGTPDVSGFAGWTKIFRSQEVGTAWTSLFATIALVVTALVVWRRAAQTNGQAPGVHHPGWLLVALVALSIAAVFLVRLGILAREQLGTVPANIAFLAPVQQAGSSLTVDLSNVPDRQSAFAFLGYTWPIILSLLLWVHAWRTDRPLARTASRVLAWTFLAWTSLRCPYGTSLFSWVLVAFLLTNIAIPIIRQVRQFARHPARPHNPGESGAASAVTALIIIGVAGFASGAWAREIESAPSTPESVTQEIRIEDEFAHGTAKIKWQAKKGEALPLLVEPAVLTHFSTSRRTLKLSPTVVDGKRVQQVLADRSDTFEIEVQYQLHVTKSPSESAIALPTPYGLVNRVNATVVGADVDVFSPQAVSVQRELSGTNTLSALVLSPTKGNKIGWRPRSRDVRREKATFYADVTQLYVPAAGVIEGLHQILIRPAQGELSELVFTVPNGATITDVLDANQLEEAQRTNPTAASTPSATSGLIWRFDPDTRKLRVTLKTAQSRPFVVLVRSQISSGTLPFDQLIGLISVDNAAGQMGLFAVATGNEVQLDGVANTALSPINLEDFPPNLASALSSQFPGLTVRRAFRYSDSSATATIKASAVEPDIRVETQDTLSLGEDRTVLASTAVVDITRAGIFRLSFVLPAGFDVESISGSALSHWTELKNGNDRVITLHLPGKTDGRQQFTITLAGLGVKASGNWPVPQLLLREASKQRGTLLVVPEQGMRLQVAARDGVTQLDPQKSGIRQKGVLAFRVLQAPANLALDIEQVDPWIQVTSLQHAIVTEAQVKVAANLQYLVENTGLKVLHVFVPTNAEGVRFRGEQVADFLAVAGTETNGLQEWEVKLHRRVIGTYLLQVNYQTPLGNRAAQTILQGVQAADVNLQRGFVTIQSDPRLQVAVETTPPSLQSAEWQSIPRALQQDLTGTTASFTYRLVEPAFQLPLKLERHEAARLLPARISSVDFQSVISDDGVMLTRAQLAILPGDKRLLSFTLPANGRFWFAFVDQNGVWPWTEQDRILIPLEHESRMNKPVIVELFYSGPAGRAGSRSLDLELMAPKFDLPLENITWRVALGDKWDVKHWSGSLQLQQQEIVPEMPSITLDQYLQNESELQLEKTRQAHELMAAANTALDRGDPQQARRAFQAAFGLSTHDAAFNEDARVQLHNIKLQQALVGLNVRQAAAAGDGGALEGKLRDVQNRNAPGYTQQDAKDIIDRNTADENAAFMRLAERLVQQQDAAVSSASALRASLSEQGRVLTFKRAVVVEPSADLQIGIEAVAKRAVPFLARIAIIVTTIGFLAIVKFGRRKTEEARI